MKKKYIVEIPKKVLKRMSKEYHNGILSKSDLLTIQEWKQIIEDLGLSEMANDKKWRDHKLVGNWAGYRSSSFSKLGRIIYKIEDGVLSIVKVEKITGGHDYDR